MAGKQTDLSFWSARRPPSDKGLLLLLLLMMIRLARSCNTDAEDYDDVLWWLSLVTLSGCGNAADADDGWQW